MSEIVEVYDANGLKRGYTKPRASLSDNEYILSVHIYIYNDDLDFIIQQRAFNKKELPGIWCMTGGAVEINEDSINAAIREVDEELSIKLEPNNIRYLGRCLNNNYIVDLFSAKTAYTIKDIILKEDEVIDVKLLNIDDTITYVNTLDINQQAYKDIINQKLRLSLINT